MALQLPLDRALAATNSGIVIADATVEGFPLTYVNAAFERLTGYDASECIGRNCRFLQGPGTDPAAVAELSRALREGEESRSVLLNYRKDGSAFQNELRMAPIRDEASRVVQVIGVQNDVTEIVREHEAILAERDRARISLQRASQVIARQDQKLAELRALQEALTPPRPPARPHLALASCFLPAEEGVAGDFYLVAAGPGDATIFVVGDVMGHGLHAARRATFVRTALATFSRFTDDPLRLLEMANHSLIERIGTSAEFVTAVCASYRPSLGRLQWAAAGHPAPIALDSGDPVGALTRVGAPLGIEIDLGGSRAEVPFLPGQGLLLYTDGLPEARSAPSPRSGAPRLGDERVRDLVRHLPGEEPQRIVDCLCAEAVAHTGGVPADDLCLVALRAT
jgi:PAS domain S-box-containing protein